MAMTETTTAPAWSRWQGSLQHPYGIMDAQSYPYDSRSMTVAASQRPSMAPQLLLDASFLHTGQHDSLAPSPYAHTNYAYSSLPTHQPRDGSYGLKDTFLKPYTTPFAAPGTINHHQRYMGHAQDPRSYDAYQAHLRPPSPAPSSDYQVSPPRYPIEAPAPAKTITLNETLDPNQSVKFDTEIDELMKTIQTKGDEMAPDTEQMPTPAQSPTAESQQMSLLGYGEQSSPSKKTATKARKWVCDGPNCGKAFVQKTHLYIHRRTHTGEKPYRCDFPGCGHAFTQAGNLKTHERRHIQEKPFQCSQCDKKFAQRGNVRAHEKTHQKDKPFVCRLDDCGKSFSQLGNMKTHQNTFHKDALKDLTEKFARWSQEGAIHPADLELFEYFKQHYKNSNKGIKGRGKGRTVAPRLCNTPPRSRTTARSRGPHLKRDSVSPLHHMYMASPSASPISPIDPRDHHAQYMGYIQDPRPTVQPMMYEDGYRHMLPAERLYSTRY